MKYVRPILSILLTFIFAGNLAVAQVAINPDGSPPAPSAMLDINAPDRGFLPPRLELTAANLPDPVQNPASGLLIYNTRTSGSGAEMVTPGYYNWNGDRWIPVSPPGGANQGDMAYWNGSGWVIIPAGGYGESLIFCNGVPTWGGCLPLVTTGDVIIQNDTTVTANGTVTSDGGTDVTTRGICWGVTPDPTIEDQVVTSGEGIGSFDVSITGLPAGTTWYFRAFATNHKGTSYGPAILKSPSDNPDFRSNNVIRR